MSTLHLAVTRERLAIARLEAGDPVPGWFDVHRPFCALVRSGDELSLVCAEDEVPEDVPAQRGWRALSVHGPLDFGLTGILAGLAGPLAAAGIPVFAISTFDTDHVLVSEDRLPDAIEALRGAGHEVS